jgi:hypothetical protein
MRNPARQRNVDIQRNLGRKRITGAGGRKLGPIYPRVPTFETDRAGVERNIRYYYKTKGFGHRVAVGKALDDRDKWLDNPLNQYALNYSLG